MGAGPVAEVAACPVGSQEDDEGSSCDEPELTLLPAESGSSAVAQWLDPGVGPYNGAYAGLCSPLGAPCECQALVFLVMANSEVVGALAVDLFSRRRTRAACRICFDTAAAEMLVGVCACRGSGAAVHEQCLVQWAKHNLARYSRCPTCKHAFTGRARVALEVEARATAAAAAEQVHHKLAIYLSSTCF